MSIGPVAAVAKKWGADKQKQDLTSFYRPIIWMHDNTFLQKPLEWYVVDVWDAN